MSVILHSDIRHILAEGQTCDVLCCRTKFHLFRKGTYYGLAIRRMLGRGRYRCYTNHNAPTWRDGETNELMMLQISAPAARIMRVQDYLAEAYSNGNRAILVRAGAYDVGADVEMLKKAQEWSRGEWIKMEGVPYDNPSIKQIAKMYMAKKGHTAENDKTSIYCTEGTCWPFKFNPYIHWQPDVLRNERFPVPIHFEHMLRQQRVRAVAGNPEIIRKIVGPMKNLNAKAQGRRVSSTGFSASPRLRVKSPSPIINHQSSIGNAPHA